MGNRILIIDDDSTFNNLLTDIFEQAGHEVVSERDPKQALAIAEKDELQLLITDHRMPELTGRELFLQIRKIKPDLPVIIVSGF